MCSGERVPLPPGVKLDRSSSPQALPTTPEGRFPNGSDGLIRHPELDSDMFPYHPLPLCSQAQPHGVVQSFLDQSTQMHYMDLVAMRIVHVENRNSGAQHSKQGHRRSCTN